MNIQTIQAEAETVELARAELKAKISPGFFVQSEEILSAGQIQTSRGMAETYAEAVTKAKANVPFDSRTVEMKEIQKVEDRIIYLEAENQEAAQALVKEKMTNTDILMSLKLAVPAKKGILGIGKTLDKFQAEVLRQSIVEITYKKNAFIKVTVSDQIASWQPLLASLKSSGTSLQANSLFEQFPYQVLFVILSKNLDDPAYFNGIPFVPITQDVIARAKRYVEKPQIPILMRSSGGGLDPDRYVIKPDGKVYRKANLMIDSAIASVADCLKGRGNFSFNDPAGISRLAYDAIVHYAGLPAAAFFFSLPYLETVVTSKALSIQEV
jgi:hypothetical protein